MDGEPALITEARRILEQADNRGVEVRLLLGSLGYLRWYEIPDEV